MSKYQDHLFYLISRQVMSKSRDPSLQHPLHVVGITRLWHLCYQLFLPEAQFRYFYWREGDKSGSKKIMVASTPGPHLCPTWSHRLCSSSLSTPENLVAVSDQGWVISLVTSNLYYFFAAMWRWGKSSSKPCYVEMLLIWFPQVSSIVIRPKIQSGTMVLK